MISLDNRGAGKSDRPNIPYTMNMFVDDIKELMDHLDIKKTHMIGWALGGMTVQNFALEYPEKVDKIIPISSNYGFPNNKGPQKYLIINGPRRI